MVGDALSIHIQLEFKVVFTVVIAVAACVAGWRYIRAARKRARQDGAPDESTTP